MQLEKIPLKSTSVEDFSCVREDLEHFMVDLQF